MPTRGPDTGDETTTTGTPRWVKVFGVIAFVVVLLIVVLLLAGGPHNPGRHTAGDDTRSVGASPA